MYINILITKTSCKLTTYYTLEGLSPLKLDRIFLYRIDLVQYYILHRQ